MTESKQQRYARQIVQLEHEIGQYHDRRRLVPDNVSVQTSLETYRRNGDDNGDALHHLLGRLIGCIRKGTFTTSDADAVIDAISASLEFARPKNGNRR
jgi:hypothetical protein